jgi:hypothetical protein
VRIPNAVHQAQPWVISDIAPDFELLDVWAMPVHGGPDDFASFLEALSGLDPTASPSPVSRALFWVRERLGEVFGWDDGAERPIPGCDESTLRARLPEDLRNSADADPGSDVTRPAVAGFTPLYRTDDEWAAELSNATVHGVLHVAWVPDGDKGHRAHLAVYVKTRGRLGSVYMALIQPFRHLVVYPALTRQIGRAWDRRNAKEA